MYLESLTSRHQPPTMSLLPPAPATVARLARSGWLGSRVTRQRWFSADLNMVSMNSLGKLGLRTFSSPTIS